MTRGQRIVRVVVLLGVVVSFVHGFGTIRDFLFSSVGNLSQNTMKTFFFAI